MKILKVAFAALAMTAAVPASAALVAVPGGACNITTPAPDAIACAGAYDGNLNNASSIGDLNLALDALMGGSFSPNVVWANLDPTKAIFSGGSGTTLNFSQTLFGQQILSLHFGNAGTGLGNRTILYLFDFGAAGANSIVLNTQGWSNGVLITPPGTAVPEPATWAMMLMGFGVAGFALRRRRPALIKQVA